MAKKQNKAAVVMKIAAKKYNAYKKSNPKGSKKICEFVKEEWKGRKKNKK